MGKNFNENRDMALKIISMIMIVMAIGIIAYGEKSFRKKIEARVAERALLTEVEDVVYEDSAENNRENEKEENLLRKNKDVENHINGEDELRDRPLNTIKDTAAADMGKISSITVIHHKKVKEGTKDSSKVSGESAGNNTKSEKKDNEFSINIKEDYDIDLKNELENTDMDYNTDMAVMVHVTAAALTSTYVELGAEYIFKEMIEREEEEAR